MIFNGWSLHSLVVEVISNSRLIPNQVTLLVCLLGIPTAKICDNAKIAMATTRTIRTEDRKSVV